MNGLNISTPEQLFQVLCDTAKALDFTTLYQQQNAAKMVFSAIAVPIIVYMIFTKKYLIYGEHHFIIHFKIAIVLLYALNNTVSYALQITDRLLNPDNPCQWVRLAKDCVIHKALQMSTSTTISTTLFFITLEKGIFVVVDPSTRVQKILTWSFSIIQFTWTLAVFITTFFFDYSNTIPVLHCSEPTARTVILSNIVSYLSIVCSCCTLVSSVLLKYYISRMIRRETNLTRSFQLRQSKVTNNAFLPLILFNAVTILLLNVIFINIRPILGNFDKEKMKAIQGIANMTPYYAFIAPLLLMYGMHRLKEGREKEFTQHVQPKIDGKVVPAMMIYENTVQKMWR